MRNNFDSLRETLLTTPVYRTIHLPASSVFTALSRPVPSNTPVICASQTPFLIDIENTDQPPAKFPAMRNQIHTVISSSAESAGSGTFLASDGERFINVFDASNQKLVRNLVADQDVSSVSLYDAGKSALEKQVLAAVTENGTIELFTKPFAQPQTAQSASAKANRKQMTQKANASLKIIRSESSDACVPVVSTSFQGHEIIVAYAEGGVIPVFERVKLIDETTDELAFTGIKAVVKSKSSSVIASATTNGVKNASESQVNEAHAVVEHGNLVDDDVEMNDDAASVSGSEEDSDDEKVTKPATEKKSKPTKQSAADEDVEMQNAESENEDEEVEEGAEPSFGELLRANAGQEVDVEAELDDDVNLGALVPGKPTAAVQQIPTGVSLATVLTQSLKTNDNGMLESCFHTNDTSIIRTTIQRLESPLAATLLQKLAERLSSRPGRYGHLLIWVQWTCVAHGGALAGHPELLKRMATLYKVMDQRSSSLPSLLLLKGKLDMLDAQLGLRSSMRGDGDDMDSDDEDNVIYVEGQEDDDDSETEAKPRTKSIRDQAFDEDESMMNGVDESEDDEDDGSEEEDEDEEGILDIEAEESAGSSDAEESLEENEDDEDDEGASEGSLVDFIADTEDEESDAAIEQPPPTKKAKTSAKKKSGRK